MYQIIIKTMKTRRLTSAATKSSRRSHSCGLSKSRSVYNEFVGKRGVEATRYGDWEYAGRCTDF